MTTHVYALFDEEKDYNEAYVEAQREGLIDDSENLKTCRNIENEDDIPFVGTSMKLETFGYALGGLLVGAVVGNLISRMPLLSDVPPGTMTLLVTLGLGSFGFLCGIFIGASRIHSRRQALWKSFRPGNLAVLLDMRHKATAKQMASLFLRHHARLVDVV
jgi:hypothetical protein